MSQQTVNLKSGIVNQLGRGSSVVEQATENRCVVSPILTLGTRRFEILEYCIIKK
jgi:hypothetical protein